MSNSGDKIKLGWAFREVIWMAMRYANGRQTTSPSTVRWAIKMYREVHPGWQPRPDKTLAQDKQRAHACNGFRNRDWLDDLTEGDA